MDPDPEPGGSGSDGYGSGYATLLKRLQKGDLEELSLCEREVLLCEDVEEDVLLQLPPLLRVDQGLQRLVHLLRRVERDVVLHGKSVTF
jgi:hypothetical protein